MAVDVSADAELGRRIPYGEPVHSAIMDFLVEEANLLDRNLLDDWVLMLADDLTYKMPVRVTLSRDDGVEFDPVMSHLDEDLPSIKLRIRRVLHTNAAYAENPPSRVRRTVTNVRVHRTAVDGQYRVSSHLLVLRNRWDLPTYDILSCLRDDVLRVAGETFTLASRRVLVDQATLGTPNIAILL